MKLILNEKDILNKSLEKGYIDNKKPINTIKILAKHYLSIGMNVRQTIDSINNFLLKNMDKYNSVKWINSIETMVIKIHKAKDYKLLDIKQVEITEKELDTIKNIDNEKYEKLAFVLLVYAKIYNQINENDKNWVNAEHKDIFSDAKIAIKIIEQGKMIYQLVGMGLVESTVIVDKTNIKVNFANKESKVVLVISDFRNYVYEYLRWKGRNIKECENEECKILFSPTNNSNKYCKNCAKKLHNEVKRNTWHKNKDKYRNARQTKDPVNP